MISLQSDLRTLAAQHMAQDPAHDLGHLDRVWQNAKTIATHENMSDIRPLLAASYLHDLVNLPKNAPDRHLASHQSAIAAAPLMRNLGLTDPQIATAYHAIEAHSFSANIPPKTPTARILRDADRLDAIGAIGIARWFSVSGGLARPIHAPGDPFAMSRSLDDRLYALDHWCIKLQNLSADMQTEMGRSMAQSRHALMVDFLRDIASEMGAELPHSWSIPPELGSKIE